MSETAERTEGWGDRTGRDGRQQEGQERLRGSPGSSGPIQA